MSQQGRLIDLETNLETLTGNSGGAVSPDGTGTINVVGTDTTTVVGNPGTNTLTITPAAAGYPITPFVVGPAGSAGYQTVQAALDAANTAGGGIVGVQPATYTENLTLYDATSVVGLTNSLQDTPVVIVGVHTPPASGTFGFDKIRLESATDIFNSAVAGTATLYVNNGAIDITNGYIWNLPNWTGTFNGNDMGDAGSTNNGIANNSGAAVIFLNNGVYGAGTLNTFTSDAGLTRLDLCEIACPSNFSGGFLDINIAFFTQTMTLSGNVLGIIFNALFATVTTACITYSTTGSFSIFQTAFDTSNNPSIGGAGAGTITLTEVNFIDDDNIAGTLTLASGTSYSGTLKTDYTNHGFLFGQGSATNVVASAAPLSGQLPIGSTGVDPVLAGLTGGTNITVTNGPGSITIDANVLNITSLDDTDSPYTALATDYYLSCNVSAGVLTIDLPDAPTTGRVFIVKDSGGDAGANNITVTTVGGVVNIDGAATFVMNTAFEASNFIFNGTSYEVW